MYDNESVHDDELTHAYQDFKNRCDDLFEIFVELVEDEFGCKK